MGAVAHSQDAQQPSAEREYGEMVRAMQGLAFPNAVRYEESVEPHGMSLAIRDQKGTPTPTLDFTRNAEPTQFSVHETASQTDVTDRTTGQHYVGSKIFWCATWPGALVASARPGTNMQPSPSPTNLSNADADAGTVAAVDRATANVIGQVSTMSDRYYSISDVGRTTVAGKDVIHLRFAARTDPVGHPLTDAYIDVSSHLVRRAIAAFKNEAYVSGYSGMIDLHFDSVGRYWIVVSGRIEARAHFLLTRASGYADFSLSGVTFDESAATSGS